MDADRRYRRNLFLLWLGQFVSATGDAFFLMVVAWMAGRTGGSEVAVGMAVFLGAVPFLIFGPFAGAWVDRADRRRLMIGSDVARALVLLALPGVAWLAGGLTYALVAATAFLVATLSTPFMPARDAMLPDLAGRRSLTRPNALLQTSWQIAQILGLLLGGVLLAGVASGQGSETSRVLTVLGYDGATFLLSALAIGLIVVPRRPRPARPPTRLGTDVRAGLRYALRDPVVGGLLLLTALDNLALMGPAMVGPTLLLQDMDLSVGHLAWFEGAMALGMLGGALWIARQGPRLSPSKFLLVGMVLDGLTYLPFVVIESYTLMLVAIAFHGLFIPLIVVGRTSLLQRYVPDEQRGKVFALVGITVSGMTALSAAASGLIAYVAGPRGLFAVAGVFATLCGVAGIVFLGRRLREAEQPAAESPRVS